MGNYVNSKTLLFKGKANKRYVDKSMLIDFVNGTIDNYNCFTCVSRPHRFGKTMALDMLQAYYSKAFDSRELFRGLKIESSPSFGKHLNKYAVLCFSALEMLNDAKMDHNLEGVVQYMQSSLYDVSIRTPAPKRDRLRYASKYIQ